TYHVNLYLLEKVLLPCIPYDHVIGTRAKWVAIVIVRLVDVATLEQMPGQRPAEKLHLIWGVHFLIVDDSGQRIRRIHRCNAIETIGALRFPVALVDRVDGEFDVGRRMWATV